MARSVVGLVLEMVLAILVALGLGALLQWVTGATDLAAGTAESARLLFFFMDVGLGVWGTILIVLAVRRRSLPGVGATLLAAVIGVIVNALTVTVVGTVQGGAETRHFVAYALEAGICFLVAVLVVAPLIRRLFGPAVNPSRTGGVRA